MFRVQLLRAFIVTRIRASDLWAGKGGGGPVSHEHGQTGLGHTHTQLALIPKGWGTRLVCPVTMPASQVTQKSEIFFGGSNSVSE